MPYISIVSPVYRADAIVPQLVERLRVQLDQITKDYEIILVEDCSPDDSWQQIVAASAADPRVRGIKLSRNFGQHHAIAAGIDHAHGEWVVVMDCDLQDRPEEIPRLLEKAHEGFDIVLARRVDRKDPLLKRMYSSLFYAVLGYLTETEQDAKVANFGVYSRKVITEVRRLRESIRYFPAMVKWVGFNRATIDVEHAERENGKSSYNFRRMLDLALSIILAFSDKPLRMTVKLGLLFSMIAFIMTIYTVFKWYMGGIEVIGYASLITSIWFLSGMILVTLGVVGLYVGRIFEGVKERPIYIIEKEVGARAQ